MKHAEQAKLLKETGQNLNMHQATVHEKMVYIECALGVSADKHATLVEKHAEQAKVLRVTDQMWKVPQRAKQERMDYMERTTGDSADKPATLAELQAEHAQMQKETDNHSFFADDTRPITSTARSSEKATQA